MFSENTHNTVCSRWCKCFISCLFVLSCTCRCNRIWITTNFWPYGVIGGSRTVLASTMNRYYSICAMLRYMNAIHIQIFRYSAMTKTILVATRITYDTKHIYSPMVSIRWRIRLCWTLSLIVRQNPSCCRLCYITDGLVICIINPHRRQIISNNSRISWLSIIIHPHFNSFKTVVCTVYVSFSSYI